MFFFDIESNFLGFDPAFKPDVSPLDRLQHSNILGSAVEFQGELMSVDRRSGSAMHCWASE